MQQIFTSLGAELSQQVLSGPLVVAIPIAVLAGLVSFVSPCVLPLVPGYLAYAAGLAGNTAAGKTAGGRSRTTGGAASNAVTETATRVSNPDTRRLIVATALFIAGFTAVFLSMGIFVGAIGGALLEYQDLVTRVLGLMVAGFGVIIAAGPALSSRIGGGGGLRVAWRPSTGLLGAPLLGVVFGIGWAPCMGPVLAAVLSLALTTGSATHGAILAGAYCVGLGIPFFGVAVGLGRGLQTSSWLRKHRVGLARGGGIVIVVLGILLASGVWTQVVDWVRIPIDAYGTVI